MAVIRYGRTLPAARRVVNEGAITRHASGRDPHLKFYGDRDTFSRLPHGALTISAHLRRDAVFNGDSIPAYYSDRKPRGSLSVTIHFASRGLLLDKDM